MSLSLWFVVLKSLVGNCVQLGIKNISKCFQFVFQLQESDFDERSLSLCESTETSERMCGDFFNTVKKGPGKGLITTIEPPLEFQVPLDLLCTFKKIYNKMAIYCIFSVCLMCHLISAMSHCISLT